MPRTIAVGASATIDRDMLHRALFARADSRHVLRIHQMTLAAEYQVSKFTVSRIIHEFLDEGRIRKLATTKGNVASYVIIDPATFTAR